MTNVVPIPWDMVTTAAEFVAERQAKQGHVAVYGVPMGGHVPAALVASMLNVPLVPSPSEGVLVVDDLVDTGRTLGGFNGNVVDALFRKTHSPGDLAPHAVELDGWLTFPWESDGQAGPEDAVVRLLEFVGEDPNRAGLRDTPKRVVKALGEMTAGYNVDVADLLGRTFNDNSDEMVVVTGIEFTSMCEHHMLTFTGTAAVGYIPQRSTVVGLSKLARVVDAYAQRLQVQERLTSQIANAVEQHLRPLGVGVVVRARHSCMGCRGVRKPGAEMVTSSMLGALRTDPAARAEFLRLLD